VQHETAPRVLTPKLLVTLGVGVAVLMMFGVLRLSSHKRPPLAPRIEGDFHGALVLAPGAGDFLGAMAGPGGRALHLKLHIRTAADGTLGGTLDLPDEGTIGMACTDFHVDGGKFSFAVSGGTWSGTIESAGATLDGTWTQGDPTPLTFTRDNLVAASKPSAVDACKHGRTRARKPGGSRSP
jgi:hypothetical protein